MRGKMNYIKYLQWILIVVLLCGCSENADEDFQEVELSETQTAVSEDSESSSHEEAGANDQAAETLEDLEYIVVYVCGEVEMPGVYTLEAGSRICDAIRAAGGQTSDAAEAYLNQAQILTDGEKIYVPSREESLQMESGDAATAPDAAAGKSNKVSINQAGKEELMTLQGIGESKAEAIIAYRKANGGFQTLEELMQVDGIKEGTYEKIKDLISL